MPPQFSIEDFQRLVLRVQRGALGHLESASPNDPVPKAQSSLPIPAPTATADAVRHSLQPAGPCAGRSPAESRGPSSRYHSLRLGVDRATGATPQITTNRGPCVGFTPLASARSAAANTWARPARVWGRRKGIVSAIGTRCNLVVVNSNHIFLYGSPPYFLYVLPYPCVIDMCTISLPLDAQTPYTSPHAAHRTSTLTFD